MKSVFYCALGMSCLALVGCSCDDNYATKQLNNLSSSSDTQRFSIVHVSTFVDWLAYNSKRGIYIITDSYTGKEYVGVSGVGISELGSHQAGRTNITDER